MKDPTNCKHNLYWYAAPADERGWKCAYCDWRPGEEPGYSPEHDRDLLRHKIWCIAMDLHDKEVVYISNSDCGEILVSAAERICQDRQACDSVSIARVVLEIEGDDKHAAFWRGRHVGILSGQDPRARCHCGVIAKQWCNGKHACCHEHMQIALGRDPMEPF